MEIVNQNTEAKQTEENQIVIGQEEIFTPFEAELRQLRAELSSERDARLRLAAEYENYRRRTKRERERAAAEGRRELLTRLLSIADDLDLTLEHSEAATDVVAEGIKLVHKRFAAMLQANDVVSFKSVGEIFNPELHEAFDLAHGTGLKPGTVQAEIRSGYFWGNRLLRPALVVVAA